MRTLIRNTCFFLLGLFAGCGPEQPYLKHKLAYTKFADQCLGGEFPLKLTANTNGERYEFKACLPQEFSGRYIIQKSADTLVLHFPDTLKTTTAFFDLVLEVNTWPKYKYIKLGDMMLKAETK